MDSLKIQAGLDAAALRFMNLGFHSVKASIELNSLASVWVRIQGTDENDIYKVETAFADTPAEALTRINKWLNAIPSKEDRERTEYLKRVASAIEYGKKIGIDEAFINPLEMQMKRLSANIIEHKPAPAGDGIPL